MTFAYHPPPPPPPTSNFHSPRQRFHKLGATIPKGVLLVGPPGTGKTLMAKAMAGEAGVPFISLSGSDFSSEYAGVGTAMVKRLFRKARKHGRCIIFIDEIDTIGRRRSGKDSAIAIDSESTLNQLLVEMDGFDQKKKKKSGGLLGKLRGKRNGLDGGVLILAGTNRADMLDKALTRAGRFDRIVNVDPPDVAGRRELFAKYMEPLPLAELSEEVQQQHRAPAALSSTMASVSLPDASPTPSSACWWQPQSWRLQSAVAVGKHPAEHAGASRMDAPPSAQEPGKTTQVEELDRRQWYAKTLSEMTPGFTGAQVSNLCNEAALRAAALNAESITIGHFSDALDRMLGGLERSKYIPLEDLKRTAVHEAGHALCAWFTTHSQPPLKVSVVWRGDTLGFTQLKGFERTGKTRAILEDELTVLLAGRVAEELVFGDPSTGASHDLQRVTQIAYNLVASTGYSSKVGLVSLLSNEHGQHFPHMSDDTAKLIDNEVRRVVNKAYDKTKKMLKKHMPKLRRMTEELLEREVLLEEDILRCFGPRPAPSIAAAAPYDPASCSPNDRKSSGTRDGAVSVSTESLAPTSKQLVASVHHKKRIERHLLRRVAAIGLFTGLAFLQAGTK
jgi:ATP-dependent Zn protease